MAGYELNYEALDDADKKKEVTAAEEFIDWVETIIGAFFAVIIIFTFLLRVANVDGARETGLLFRTCFTSLRREIL